MPHKKIGYMVSEGGSMIRKQVKPLVENAKALGREFRERGERLKTDAVTLAATKKRALRAPWPKLRK